VHIFAVAPLCRVWVGFCSGLATVFGDHPSGTWESQLYEGFGAGRV
jgi:hypothetical protein